MKQILPDEHAMPNVTKIVSNSQVGTLKMMTIVLWVTMPKYILRREEKAHLLEYKSYRNKQCIGSSFPALAKQKRMTLFGCSLHIFQLLN